MRCAALASCALPRAAADTAAVPAPAPCDRVQPAVEADVDATGGAKLSKPAAGAQDADDFADMDSFEGNNAEAASAAGGDAKADSAPEREPRLRSVQRCVPLFSLFCFPALQPKCLRARRTCGSRWPSRSSFSTASTS